MKKRYYVAFCGEGICEGYVWLTDRQASIIKAFLCVGNWEDVHDEEYSPRVIFMLAK